MKAALIVNRVEADRTANLEAVLRLAEAAVRSGANLVLLAEAAITGLVNNDDPAHDLPLGEPIPGPSTERLAAFCRRHAVWLGLGLLERDSKVLYDAAVLLDASGGVALRYRRHQPQWHGRDADPRVYAQGTGMDKAETPFGSMGFLLCGDLFDDAVAARFRALRADWLLFPFARCFGDGSADQGRWDRDELPQYLARIRSAGAPALMVNYLGGRSLVGDNSFGGAYAVSARGEVVASLQLGVEGVLMVDLGKTRGR